MQLTEKKVVVVVHQTERLDLNQRIAIKYRNFLIGELNLSVYGASRQSTIVFVVEQIERLVKSLKVVFCRENRPMVYASIVNMVGRR